MFEGTRCARPASEVEVAIEKMAATVVAEQLRDARESWEIYTLWRDIFIRLWTTRKPLTIPERNYIRQFMAEGLFPAGPIHGFWSSPP
jgi:hypothetical protein